MEVVDTVLCFQEVLKDRTRGRGWGMAITDCCVIGHKSFLSIQAFTHPWGYTFKAGDDIDDVVGSTGNALPDRNDVTSARGLDGSGW